MSTIIDKDRTLLLKPIVEAAEMFRLNLLILLVCQLQVHNVLAQMPPPFAQQPQFMPQQPFLQQNLPEQLVGEEDVPVQALNIISGRGFIGEMYQILSPDGAVLNVYHMINPLADQSKLVRWPMLIGHGLGGDASQMMGRSEFVRPRRPDPFNSMPTLGLGDECLPFAYANNNFDVWLFDARGTNKHNHNAFQDLNPLAATAFYNYTLDEQSQLDLPTIIDFVLWQTQSDKLFYTGYSESTILAFMLLSGKPEYADKMMSAVLLAPIAYLTKLRGLITFALASYLLPENLHMNFLPEPINNVAGTLIRRICSLRNVASETVCQAVGRATAGNGETDYSPAFYASFFKGTSTKVIKHLSQMNLEQRFGMFDYGPAGNLQKYGQVTPPDYDLTRFLLPTLILVRGGNDFLSTLEDQITLLEKLRFKPYADIYLPKYNHLDLTLGTNSKTDVSLPVLLNLFNILSSTGMYNLRNAPVIPLQKPIRVKLPFEVNLGEPIQYSVSTFGDLIKGFREDGIVKQTHLDAPLKIAENLGKGVDAMTDSLNQLPDKLLSNPMFSPLTNILNIGSGATAVAS